jgi:hypothetical protein
MNWSIFIPMTLLMIVISILIAWISSETNWRKDE